MENKKLTDLEMIDSIIASTYAAISKHDDSGKAIATFEKMLKLKKEYSDEHIQKWLLDRGYVAVPIVKVVTDTL